MNHPARGHQQPQDARKPGQAIEPLRLPIRGNLSLTELAAYLKISRPTAYHARRTDRLVIADGYVTYTPSPRGPKKKKPAGLKRCAYCHRHGGRRGSSKLCADCVADGKRWCSPGQHVTTLVGYYANHHACTPCHNRITREHNRRQRGLPIGPPEGYITPLELAQRVGYSRIRAQVMLANGWLRELTWRASDARGSRWYIKDQPTYPLWEKKQRKASR